MVSGDRDNPTGLARADIAIVGMACLFPGADSPAQFWHNIVNSVDQVTDPPPDWQPELFLDPTGEQDDRVYTGRGGYFGDLCRFNPARYGVMPGSVEGSEPDHFIALRCAFEAVADAGVPEIPLNRETTGVILGRGTYVNRGYVTSLHHGFIVDQVINVLRQVDPDRPEKELATIKAELKRNMPPLNADTVPGLAHSVLVGRIANRLDLHGPVYTVDGACASSLLAVEAGMRELRSGRCDAMLVGGVSVSMPAVIDLLFCHLGALSRTGRIAPFSKDADGTLLGQGCGIVVLKRRRDAEQDGNRIYAVLNSIGVASDGRGGGLLAPQQEGQEFALRRAYAEAGLPTSAIELVEAHGTGIPLGDVTEVRSLTECFGARGACGPTIALGSVKSMISHLIPAAGIAALIKTALALYHRVLPPTIHATEPNPDLHLNQTPFYLCTTRRPWIHADRRTPRRAGINAFGFGGINAHAILEEHRVTDESALTSLDRHWPVELVVVAAVDRETLQARAEALAAWVDRAEAVSLLDIAATCAQSRESCKLAICAQSPGDLVRKLRQAAKWLGEPKRSKIQARSGIFWYEHPLANTGRLAFVFPGEGAQYGNMLADLCVCFPEVRRQFDLTDAAFRQHNPARLPSHLIFPVPAEAERAETELFEMDVAVEAVMTANRAFLALLSALKIGPDAVVGHSSGEFTALVAAGAVELADDEELIRSVIGGAQCTRRIMNSGLVPTAVLTVVGGAGLSVIEAAVAQSGGRLHIALDNCPHQVVLAGDEEATAVATDRLRRQGGLCQRVPWDRAYHTDAFSPACRIVRDYCASLRFRPPMVPLWSCVTAARYPQEPDAVAELLVRQWRCRVRFRETIQAMHAAGVRIFLEVGPRGNLTAFIGDTLAGQPHLAVPMDLQTKGGLEQLCRALAMLSAHGVSMDLDALYRRRAWRRLDFSKEPPAAEKQDPILHLELPELKLGADVLRAVRATERSPGAARRDAPAPPSQTPEITSARRRAFVDMQETMRLFLETQKNVVTRFIRPNGAGRHTNHGARRFPLVERVVLHEPGVRIITECELDVEKHRFLRDHAFGRTVSLDDPSLTALIVLPLATTIELMAETAALLRPTRRVSAVRDIRLRRWLAFDVARKRVRMEARVIGDADIRMTVFEVSRNGEKVVVATGIIEAPLIPTDPGEPTIENRANAPSRWQPDDLYTKGLFHGPAFQALASMDAREVDAARATLRRPDPTLMFGDARGHDLLVPVALVDGMGQVVGLWGAENDSRMGFPTSVQRLEIGSEHADAERYVALARIHDHGDRWLSDVELHAEHGPVALRLLGRVDRVVDLPTHFWRYRTAPREVVFSRVLRGAFNDIPAARYLTICELDGFGGPFLIEENGLWALDLAHYVLDRSERSVYAELDLPPAARASWLLGRVVAKDAVRAHLSLDACMADVGIATDRRSGTRAVLSTGEPPVISLAHTGYDAVAVAGDPGILQAVGIALDSIRPVDPKLVAKAYSPEERRLIEAAARAHREELSIWYLTAESARTAVARALGGRYGDESSGLEIIEIDAEAGRLTIRPGCASARPATCDTGVVRGETRVDAHRRVIDGRIIVLCVLERCEAALET